MTDARWARTIDFLRDAGLTKPGIDYAKAYTLGIVRDVKSPALSFAHGRRRTPVVEVARRAQDATRRARRR